MKPKAYSYVRMSTEIQSKGDSLHRQLVLSKTYAAEHNLDLQVLEPYLDIGVSAFRGLNRKSGALRKLLDDLDSGKVAAGSYILIESLDRLSRDQVRAALSLFLDIIDFDVTIVTTKDRMVYDKKGMDDQPFKLFQSIIEMSRSNSESEHKSTRIRASWASKRDHAEVKKLTKMCPHWMSLSEDRMRFDLHLDRVKILRRIFDEYNSGLGAPLIAKRLNEEEIPCWGRTDGWRDSYLKKLLVSRTVIGELDLYQRINGVRTHVKTIADYYPPAIDKGIFQTAQTVRVGKAGTGGRRGKQIANLFSHTSCCAYCGGVTRMKDGGPTGGKYLVCDRARRGVGCTTKGFPYKLLEDSFLKLIRDVDLSNLFSDAKEKSNLRESQEFIAAKEGELSDIEIKARRLVDALAANSGSSSFIVNELQKLEADQIRLGEEIRVLKEAFSAKSEKILNATEYKDQINSLTEKFELLRGDERLLMRAKVQQRIRNLIQRIELRPAGKNRSDAFYERAKTDLGDLDIETADAVVARMRAVDKLASVRSYVVWFHSGRHVTASFAEKSTEEPTFVLDSADENAALVFDNPKPSYDRFET